MGKFKVQPRHIQFCNAVAAGMEQYKAYQQFVSPGGKAKDTTAVSRASDLAKRPEIQKILNEVRAVFQAKITNEAAKALDPVFSEVVLTVDQLDSYHSAIIQGKVEVEEVIHSYKWIEKLDANGNVISRKKEPTFVRVKRPPNIREKQVSIDAMYRRFGNYAPSRLFGAMGKVNDDGEVEDVERFVLLASGEKVPM